MIDIENDLVFGVPVANLISQILIFWSDTGNEGINLTLQHIKLEASKLYKLKDELDDIYIPEFVLDPSQTTTIALKHFFQALSEDLMNETFSLPENSLVGVLDQAVTKELASNRLETLFELLGSYVTNN